MKCYIRKSNYNDLDNIYNLHINCFDTNDQWYKSIIGQYINNGIIIEVNNQLIGVLLQGNIVPCSIDEKDSFISINDIGNNFYNNMEHLKNQYGIVMICVDKNFRNKGIAMKLINTFLKLHQNKLLCLHTRKSNSNAYNLYKKIGFQHIAYIENKYFLPNEDSIFMIYDNSNY
jgi:ribosomal protein S18 acetylase RimI-like enzyme